ncbi:MAG TPA: energy transducer TonB [Longimicrobium sp.]|nr:energy transducer TonB [Longimicrobium sp.]
MRRTLVLLLGCAAAAPAAAQPAGAPPAHEIRAVDVLPRLANKDEFLPALARLYPPALRDSSVTGHVTVRLRVGEDGVPGHAQVVKAAHPGLAAPTLAGLETLRFVPAQAGGRPAPVWVELPVLWTFAVAPGRADGVEAFASDPVDLHRPGTASLKPVEVMPSVVNVRDLIRALERGYPPDMRDAGVEATVVALFRVDAGGRVTNVAIAQSSHPAFNGPTLRAVQVLRFRPTRVDGKAVPVWVDLPIRWTLGR